MRWKLWNSKKNKTLTQVQEILTPISQHLTLLYQQVTGNTEQITEIGDQIRKLGRLQYKTGQDVQGKLEGLGTGLDVVQQWQLDNTIDKSRLDTLEQQIEHVTEIILVWLDDLDLLTASLRNREQELWQELLRKWTSQILQALQIHGIREIKMLGTSFNPKVAESIATMARKQVIADMPNEESTRIPLPYEITEVVKRGFIDNDGRLLRKAQVITYEEDSIE